MQLDYRTPAHQSEALVWLIRYRLVEEEEEEEEDILLRRIASCIGSPAVAFIPGWTLIHIGTKCQGVSVATDADSIIDGVGQGSLVELGVKSASHCTTRLLRRMLYY